MITKLLFFQSNKPNTI